MPSNYIHSKSIYICSLGGGAKLLALWPPPASWLRPTAPPTLPRFQLCIFVVSLSRVPTNGDAFIQSLLEPLKAIAALHLVVRFKKKKERKCVKNETRARERSFKPCPISHLCTLHAVCPPPNSSWFTSCFLYIFICFTACWGWK